MTPAVESIAFVGTVLVVAILTWMMRSWVESDPDPFILNLTFFAMGGQWIRTIEYFFDRKCFGNLEDSTALTLVALLVIGIFVSIFQVFIMRAHMNTTRRHYEHELRENTKEPESEVKKWAVALLQTTGTDFSPGSYEWLSSIFKSDPRKKSREEAVAMVPDNFRLKGLNANSLTVPEEKRRGLWRSYIGLCLVAWGLFIFVVIASHKGVTLNSESLKPAATSTSQAP